MQTQEPGKQASHIFQAVMLMKLICINDVQGGGKVPIVNAVFITKDERCAPAAGIMPKTLDVMVGRWLFMAGAIIREKAR